MFPPSSNGLSPFFQPYFTDSTSQNPSSSTAHHSSAFLHFPPAFLDENYDFLENEYFSSQQQHQEQVFGTNLGVDNSHEAQEIKPVDSETANKATRSIKNMKKRCSTTNVEKQQNPQRRTRKKDRHSKIYTAQGPRDRRMRLSLQIARKFFDLQDMLGFDKASKTIDWLFNKSKAAIKDLSDSIPKGAKQCSSSGGGADGGKIVSSTSESEVVSGIKLHPKIESFVSSPMVKESKQFQKSPVCNPLAREYREKARARARERTREKLKNKNLNNTEQLVASSPLENLDCGSQEVNCPVKGINGEDQEEQEPNTHLLQRGMDSLDLIDRFMGIENGQNFGVSNGANFEDEYSGFPATWEMNNGRIQYLCCEMPNIKSSSTGSVHEQSPNAIFLTNPPNDHHQEQNHASSIFVTSLNYQQGNPNPVLMNISKGNTTHQQNPSSILLTTATNTDFHSHHFIGDRLFCTTSPDVVNKYDNLY